MNCKECRHYGFYQMITQGPYAYAGKIPCVTCGRFDPKEDNFEPINVYKATSGCSANPQCVEK